MSCEGKITGTDPERPPWRRIALSERVAPGRIFRLRRSGHLFEEERKGREAKNESRSNHAMHHGWLPQSLFRAGEAKWGFFSETDVKIDIRLTVFSRKKRDATYSIFHKFSLTAKYKILQY